jgi:hypothetical protein
MMLPGTGGAIVGAALFGAVWLIAYCCSAGFHSFTFEPRGPGSFEARLATYTKIAETVIGLASGSVVLLAGSSILRGGSGGHLPWYYASPLVLLGLSVVYGVCFVGLLAFFYEGFLHHPNSYTRAKYSVIQAFGFSTLLSFSFAYVWLALTVANQ